MCGFVGKLFRRPLRADEQREAEARFETMGAQLSRRGPDATTTFSSSRLVVNFRRLAVVDIHGGDQPFVTGSGKLASWTNGELYNHREIRLRYADYPFRSVCDAEVVLPLYRDLGVQAFAQINGMFANALWDEERGRLLLARDRIGIKPLFYAMTPDGLLFGSELKALLCDRSCPRAIDWDATVETAEARAGATCVRGVREVPPGHVLCFSIDDLSQTSHRYWSLADFIDPDGCAPPLNAAALAEEVSALFHDAVQMRTMGDVPWGVFLSGGLDSSLVTYAARKLSSDVHAFSVVDVSTIDCGDTDNAQRLSDALSIAYHGVDFRGSEFWDRTAFGLEELEYFVWLMDGPWVSLEHIFKHELHRVARHSVAGLKIILVGQGADEFAGGYSNQKGLVDARVDWSAYLDTLAEPQGASAFIRFMTGTARAEAESQARDTYGDYMCQQAEWALAGTNLWTEDRVASGQSIETRVPFLDHRLVERMASIPKQQRADLLWDKRILRDLARRELPAYPHSHPKHGFVYTPNLTPSLAHSTEMLRRVYPAFREKYVANGEPVFEPMAMDSLFQYVQTATLTSQVEVDQLTFAMSLTIFRKLIEELPTKPSPPSLMADRSPLEVLRSTSSLER